MRSLLLLLKNNFRKRKTFSVSIIILSFLVVLVGSSAICGLKMNGDVYDKVYEESLSPDVLLCYTGENYDSSFLEELKKEKNITDAKSIEELFTSIKNKDDKEISALIGSEKSFDTNVSGNELYLSNYYFNTEQFEKGDTVEISIGTYSDEFVVSGFFEDPIFGSSIMKYNQMIISDEKFNEICETGKIGDANRKYLIYSWWKDDISDEELPDSVSETLSDFSGRSLAEFIYDKTYIRKAYTMIPNIISIVMILATFFLGLGSSYVLRYALKTSIEGDYKEIGTLKALGCYHKNIKKAYAWFYFFLVLVGGAIGYIASLVLSELICKVYLNINGIDGHDYLKDSRSIIGIIILLVFLMIAALIVMLSLRPLKKILPVEAIRGIKRKKEKNTGSIIKPKFMPFTFRLLFKQWISRAKQYLSIIIVSGLFGFLLCSVLSLNKIFSEKEQVYKILGLPQNDIVLVSEDSEKMDLMREKIASEYEIYSYSSFQQATLNIDDQSSVALIYSEIPDSLELVSGNKPHNENEIVMGYSLAQTLDKSEGDTVCIESVDGKSLTYKIAGLYQTANNLGKEFHITEEGFRKLNPNLSFTQRVLKLKDSDKIENIINKFEDNEYNVKVVNGRASTDGLISTVQSSLNVLIYVVMIIAVLLSGVITLMLTIMSVAREDGDLKKFRLLGVRLSVLRWQYIFRIVISSLIGCLIAFIVFSFVSDSMFNKLVTIAGLSKIDVTTNKWTYIIVAAVFIIAGALISAIATSRIRKYRYVNS